MCVLVRGALRFLFAVLLRCQIIISLKKHGKLCGGGKTATKSNFCARELWILQKLFCGKKSMVEKKGLWGFTGELLKTVLEIVVTDAELLRTGGKTDFFVIVFCKIADNM